VLRQRFGQADAIEYLRELNGHRELLKKLTRLHTEVEKAHAIRKAEAAGPVDPFVPRPPYCTYGLGSCVLYSPEAQGSLAVRVPTSALPCHVPYVPRTVAHRGTA
jgi:hypothetical protein